MADENRAVFAEDRNETTVVRAYLEALERERLQADGVGQRGSMRASDAHEAGAGLIGHSKRNGRSPGAFDTEVDSRALEAEFVAVASSYGRRRGICYAAWRVVGVDPVVLGRAGITATT
jgi:hypothetical protein